MRTGQTLLKNTGVLFIGRILSMVMGMFYAVALSRYIQAAGMGIIATASSLVSIISLIINFGLNELIVRDVAADKSRASSYTVNLLFVRGMLALFTFGILALISMWANYPMETVVVISIYSAVYLFDELTAICFSVFNAHERMEYSAIIQTMRDIINIGISLIAIAFKFNLFIIVAISALASLIKLIISFSVLQRQITRRFPPVDFQIIKKLMLTALPFAALTFLNTTQGRVVTPILSLYRSPQEVGWYYTSGLIVSYLFLLPNVFYQAIFPVFSKYSGSVTDDVQNVYSVSFKYLLLFGFALCAGTLVSADEVIALIFGSGFENAAISLRILGLSFFWMVGYINGTFLVTTGYQNLTTLFAGTSLIVTIFASIYLIPSLGLVGASMATILPGAAFFLPLTWFCHKKLGLRIPYLLAIKSFFAAVLMAGAVVFVLNTGINVLIAVFIVAPVCYGLPLIVLNVIGKEDATFIGQLIKLLRTRGRGAKPENTGGMQ